MLLADVCCFISNVSRYQELCGCVKKGDGAESLGIWVVLAQFTQYVRDGIPPGLVIRFKTNCCIEDGKLLIFRLQLQLYHLDSMIHNLNILLLTVNESRWKYRPIVVGDNNIAKSNADRLVTGWNNGEY